MQATITSRVLRLLALLFAISMIAASCGGDSDTSGEATDSDADTTESADDSDDEKTEVTIAPTEQEAEEDDGDAEEEAEPIVPASGTLRYVEFSPVTTFNPAGAQTAQSAYLYPVYDTLTRQRNDFSLEPNLATGWTQPDSNTWVFTLRDDVTFHDGAAFDASVMVANLDYHSSFEGNPNAAAWGTYAGAEATGDYEVTVSFNSPAPQFPLQMSLVMGMMISPNALDGSDLTRDPQGSGAWIWNAGDSEAGVTEVYDLNPEYWNPAVQGVERVTVTGVPDNNARMNALLTGEADIMATTRDAQIQTGLDGGMELVAVPNYFPYLLVVDRAGEKDAPLADPNVRRAILLAMDLDAYNDAIHAGKGDGVGGYYPSAFSQFHDPAAAVNTYDPDEAKRLLDEAGYGDGLTIEMPIMPAIAPQVELIAQMLGASGITVDLVQINNGELGPRLLSREFGISWIRALLDHPAGNLPAMSITPWDTFQVGDLQAVADLVAEASVSEDPEEARGLYAQATEILLDSGTIIPLGHAGQNAMHAPNVDGVVMGLGMQSPYPHGVRIAG